MKSPIVYTVIGDPVPLARPRISGTARLVYDSQKVLKHSVLHQLLGQRGDNPLITGPCHLDVVFYLRIPKLSVSKMQALEGKYHVYKPDTDNLVKFILDVCCMQDFDDNQGILLKDDCIVSSIHAKKLYSVTPRTVFTITEL